MDAITSTSSTNSTAATETVSSQSIISSDFETFLVMLTAQMENQDPLNPLDSQDFATQLATFSGVEQQVKTNDLLSALSSQFLTSGLGDMASWVGMDARMATPAYFDGSPVEIVANPPSFSESTELVVLDANGDEVQRLDIPVSDEPFEWAGVSSDGEPFEEGSYSFQVVAYSNDEIIDVHVPDIFAEVKEVRIIDLQTVVVLGGGDIYPSSLVTGLR